MPAIIGPHRTDPAADVVLVTPDMLAGVRADPADVQVEVVVVGDDGDQSFWLRPQRPAGSAPGPVRMAVVPAEYAAGVRAGRDRYEVRAYSEKTGDILLAL